MLVKCPHCHTDFLVDEGKFKNQHGLVVDELASCPQCSGVVTLLDTSGSSEPGARSAPWTRRLAARWGALLPQLIPAKLRNLSGSESTLAQIAFLGGALLLLVALLSLQGAFGRKAAAGMEAAVDLNSMSERDATASSAQSFVRNRLQSPRRAIFPPLNDVNIKDLGGNVLQASSWVEEQNKDGARSRTYYVCTLKRIQPKHYSLDKLVIGGDNAK